MEKIPCDESCINCYDPETKRQNSQWKHAGSPRPKKDRQRKSTHKFWLSLFWQHWHDLYALGSHWTDTQQGIICWGFKGVQEEIPSEEASTLQWHFHLDNASVHNSILVTDYFNKMGIKTVPRPPYSPDLAPCDFWLFLKLRGCRYETIEEIKEAVTKVIDTLTQEDFHGGSRSCWNGITSTLQLEEITSKGTRVSCVYYQ